MRDVALRRLPGVVATLSARKKGPELSLDFFETLI